MSTINVTNITINIGNQPQNQQVISTGEAFQQMLASFSGTQCQHEDGIISASSFQPNVVPGDMPKDANGNYDPAASLLGQLLAMLNEIDEHSSARAAEKLLDETKPQTAQQAQPIDPTDVGSQAMLAGAANVVSI